MPDRPQLKPFDRAAYQDTLRLLEKHHLNTVCMEANCPNRYECFANKTATFMVLGDTCTRNCGYCWVKKGQPGPVDDEEPLRIADAVKELGLDYAVLTCVTRDDLEDHGAKVFANTVREIRAMNPGCKVELLVSDLGGKGTALQTILDAKPEVMNHNIEVVAELFAFMRPMGSYKRSIELLKHVKEFSPKTVTKSGLMVGLGETREQIIDTMRDLREAGCDILTIGQYLRPGKGQVEVRKSYSDKEFQELKETGMGMGFAHIEAGPLVRSSYRADSYVALDTKD
jgi:lipoic acid synthetase